MPNLEVDKDMMVEIFESKENVKKTVLAVMDNRLTAAHLASDVFVLIELLDKLEVLLIGEPLVQEVPPAEEQAPTQEQPAQEQPAQEPAPAPAQEQPAQEQKQEPAPAEQPKPEQNQGQ